MTGEICSNYGKFELWEFEFTFELWSSSYGSSSYGSLSYWESELRELIY